MQKRSFLTALSSFSFFMTVSLNLMAESAAPENWGEYSNTYYPCCQYSQECCYDKANAITISPEFYHLERSRDGGTKQNGNLNGIRVSYDHIKRCKLYLGAQAFYGTGIIDGYTGGGTRIRSRWTDEMVEGNLGYTFQTNSPAYFSFTPFGGYGYFRETNQFTSPSPFDLKFTTTFGYFSYGFLSRAKISPCLTMGLNARFRSPWEPRCKISDDSEVEDIEQIVGERLQYRIEIPITYKRKFLCGVVEFGFMPFYEVREYGGKENFPFDYFKTTIDIYGVSLQGIFYF